MNRAAWIFLAVVVALGILGAYAYQRERTLPAPSAGIANPASVNCVNQGGTLEISEDANGGAVGYCHLKDGRVCEEWSLMRGGCAAPIATSTP